MRRIEINKTDLENLSKSNHAKEIAEKFNVKISLIRKRCREWKIKMIAPRKHTEETKKYISEEKKRWYTNNPDKHPWKNNSKFRSKPCEKIKEYLKSKGILFIEEFIPKLPSERNYSIDIAFPDKKVGIEVNGNQHYNPDGTLKEYYLNRHNEIELSGWKLYQIHYSLCYSETLLVESIVKILAENKKIEFDYLTYVPKRKKIKVSKIDPDYRKRPRPNTRKVTWPTKEELCVLIYKIPLTKIARQYGVSDVTVKKWCNNYDLCLPRHGYWLKKQRCR